MAENLRPRSVLPLVRATPPEHSIAVAVTCPACGQEHVHRTGRRLDEARRAAALEVAVRRAVELAPA